MTMIIFEKWEKSRRREDSIYLQKYHNLVVPIERQEQFKGLERGQRNKILRRLYSELDDDDKRASFRATHQYK